VEDRAHWTVPLVTVAWVAVGVAIGLVFGLRAKLADAYVESDELLQGRIGIGLGLLAAVDRETAPAWDRCLLLS